MANIEDLAENYGVNSLIVGQQHRHPHECDRFGAGDDQCQQRHGDQRQAHTEQALDQPAGGKPRDDHNEYTQGGGFAQGLCQGRGQCVRHCEQTRARVSAGGAVQAARWARASTACSSTLAPACRWAGSAFSTSLWLMPRSQGTKIIAVGQRRAT